MKILEVITDTNIGGAGVLLVNRLTLTDKQKYKTRVLLPRGAALCERLEKIGVEYTEMDCCADKSLDVGAIAKYRAEIKKYNPDVINTHGAMSARMAAYICRVPVKICTRHCAYPPTRRERISGRLNNLLSDCFIAVAYAARDNLVKMGVSPSKICVIINGAAPLKKADAAQCARLRRSLGIGEGTAVLGLCARLEKCKGHECLIRALRRLCDDGMNVCALLIGSGSRREELERLCKQYKIEDRVIFCGFVDDISPLMSIVDININCSVGTETSSLALSEGMSLGKPSVVSDYGGNPYMVKKGINGFVYPCGDYKKLAAYIKRLINDRGLYARMSSAASKRFESELNAMAMTEKTLGLYERLYSKK